MIQLAQKCDTFEDSIEENLQKQGSLQTELVAAEATWKELFAETERLQAERKTASKQREQLERSLERTVDKHQLLQTEIENNKSGKVQLIDRYRTEYELDLNDKELIDATPLESTREKAEYEANEIRSNIAQVGSVNMEALQELDELQLRYDTLHVITRI